MKQLVVIRGPLGVGKTTVAREVASVLGGTYLSVDEILHANGLDVVEGDIPLENFLRANQILLSMIADAFSQGWPAIVDGNFYHRAQVEDLLSHISDPCEVFTLKATLQTCIARDRSRIIRYVEEATAAVFQLVSAFDYGHVINTEHLTVNETVDTILASLRQS